MLMRKMNKRKVRILTDYRRQIKPGTENNGFSNTHGSSLSVAKAFLPCSISASSKVTCYTFASTDKLHFNSSLFGIRRANELFDRLLGSQVSDFAKDSEGHIKQDPQTYHF